MEGKREHRLDQGLQALGARTLHYGLLKWQGQGEARASGEGLGTVWHSGGAMASGEGEVHACTCMPTHRGLADKPRHGSYLPQQPSAPQG